MVQFKRRHRRTKRRPEVLERDLNYLTIDNDVFVPLRPGKGKKVYIGMERGEQSAEDIASVSSYSTNATADDLPGVGRTLDTYFYQRAGRVVERVANKIISKVRPSVTQAGPVPGEGNNALSVSASSYSTNATESDIPGTGRTLDKYVYQRVGRKIERLAVKVGMRLNIYQPAPARILHHLIRLSPKAFINLPDDLRRGKPKKLSAVLRSVASRERFGKSFVDGLSSLVKQSQ